MAGVLDASGVFARERLGILTMKTISPSMVDKLFFLRAVLGDDNGGGGIDDDYGSRTC